MPLQDALTKVDPDSPIDSPDALTYGQMNDITYDARDRFVALVKTVLAAWREGCDPVVSITIDLPKLLSISGARRDIEGLIEAWHASQTPENTRRLAEILSIVCGSFERNTGSVYVSPTTGHEYHGYADGDMSSVAVAYNARRTA